MKKTLLFVGLVCRTIYGYAQEEGSSFSFSVLRAVRVSSGYSIPLQGNCNGAELQYSMSMLNNNDSWVHVLHVKDVSINADYFNIAKISLHNVPASKGVIGNNAILTASVQFYVINTRGFLATISFGGGASYFTQDFWDNKKLDLINGSHLNTTFMCGARIQQQISQGFALFIQTHVRHASTAGFIEPNSGVNIVDAGIGICKSLDSEGPIHAAYESAIEDQGSVELSVGAGVRDEVKTGYFHGTFYDTTGQTHSAGKQWLMSASLSYVYRTSNVFAFKTSIDGVYYNQVYQDSQLLKTYQGSFSSFSHVSIGIAVGGGLFLGRLGLSCMAGTYIYQHFLESKRVYWTPSASYAITPHLSCELKTYFHGQEPHFPSVGAKYSFARLF